MLRTICVKPILNIMGLLHHNEHWLLNGLTLMRNCPDAVWGFLYAYSIQTPRPATSAMMNRMPIIPEMLMGTLRSPVNSHSFITRCSMQSFLLSHTHLGSNLTGAFTEGITNNVIKATMNYSLIWNTSNSHITLHCYVRTERIKTPLPWHYCSVLLNNLKEY
jgi:hypothetical protein